MEYCCLHGRHRYPRHWYHYPPVRVYEERYAEPSREYLEEEKLALERRLKEIQAKLGESK